MDVRTPKPLEAIADRVLLVLYAAADHSDGARDDFWDHTYPVVTHKR
jgi:hypothetical protein